ncbi:hypothetical protein [Breoghania sp.]|uniref:hypothetical protein n=1 Tax=Breoghania sp. TaxID=2065378 RepID=UPI002603BC55|nr:hypothetical protein [Breoghania sp.]MDJ0930491.1 hypothetical protein [Breoghania sp.]
MSAGGFAEPVDDDLVIDSDIQMVTRVKTPEGHLLEEARSSWLYRTKETRTLEADTFENPGMLYVERGEEIWNSRSTRVAKSK